MLSVLRHYSRAHVKPVDAWLPVAAACALSVLLAALSLPWFARNWTIPPDGSMYLLHGWNVATGRGYAELGGAPWTVRGPVFSGLLALLIRLFGRDTSHLVWAVRLLAVANPPLMVLLFARVAGWRTGALAGALLAVFGLTARLPAAFNIDALLLAVLLAALLVLLHALDRRNVRWALTAGLLFGLALLTKETVFVLLPLGWFAGALYGRSLRWVLVYYLGVAVPAAPWWAWVWLASGEVYLLGRLPAPALALALAVLAAAAAAIVLLARSWMVGSRWISVHGHRLTWLVLVIWTAAFAVFGLTTSPVLSAPATWEYFTGQVLRDIHLWFLLPFAVGYATGQARRGNRAWGVCVAALLLWTPVAALVLVEGLRTRQWMVPQSLSYGMLAGLLVSAGGWLRSARSRWRFPAFAAAAALALVVLVPAAGQVTALRSERLRLPARDPYNQVNQSERRMARWIAANVPRGETILTTWLYSYQLAYDDAGARTWVPLLRQCVYLADPSSAVSTRCGRDALPPQPLQSAVPLLSLELGPACQGFSMSVESIRRQMDSAGARYLMVTETRTPGESGTQSWVGTLTVSGFRQVFATYLTRGPTIADVHGLVLLQRLDDSTTVRPAAMSAETMLNLDRCMRGVSGAGYRAELRRLFPGGISLIGRTPGRAAAQRLVDSVFGLR